MAEYYPITETEMDEFLSSQGFQRITLPKTIELVWAKRADRGGHPISLRVYSGINPSGSSRDVGRDAIRVEVYYRKEDGQIIRIGGSKRVHRVKGWKKNLQSRIDAWEEELGPECPDCGAPMKLRKPKKDQTWKAFYGCVNWKPNNEGCSGTMPVPRDPSKPPVFGDKKGKKQRPFRKSKNQRSDSAVQDISSSMDGCLGDEMPWDRDDRLDNPTAS